MLPPNFEWRPFIDGPALYLGNRRVAFVTPLDHGDGVRVQLNPELIHRRTHFTRTVSGAMDYIQAWARRHEDALRYAYSVPRETSAPPPERP